jgi:hypothetical protein
LRPESCRRLIGEKLEQQRDLIGKARSKSQLLQQR